MSCGVVDVKQYTATITADTAGQICSPVAFVLQSLYSWTPAQQECVDCRVTDEKRQAAIAAVQEVAPQRGPVITLRHSAIVKPHPKRKRSSLKNR